MSRESGVDDQRGDAMRFLTVEECRSFLEVGILCGWDVHLLPDATAFARAFVSHDEWVAFGSDEKNIGLV